MLNLNLVFVEEGFRHKRYDVCHRGFVDCYSTSRLTSSKILWKNVDDVSESIEFRENAGFTDIERGLCSSGTTCTIRATGEIASP